MANIPSVHDFLSSYRMAYDQIKGYGREETNRAYERLLDVENRTDDIVEAQLIMEREHLVLDTVIADNRAIAREFLEAADPGYEVTSAVTMATVGVYADAKSLDEITYLGEISKGRTSDIAVQISAKVQLMTQFTSLFIAYENAKRKIREGDALADRHAQSMVMTREKIRKLYTFMKEDMGLSFEMMESTPFYRISMLNPSGLDELWRLKMVMHPDNIEGIKYILKEEILSDRTMEEILLAPQEKPFYGMINSRLHPEIREEFQRTADEMNKDIAFFKKNREEEIPATADELAGRMADMNSRLSSVNVKPQTKAGNIRTSFGSAGSSIAKDIAKSAAKDIGKGLLRGLFRR